MRSTITLLLAAGLLAVSTRAAVTGFEESEPGAFTTLKTGVGTWSAAPGHARIDSAHADLGRRCLHITGGGERTVELHLTQPAGGRVSLLAERWTARAPFAFRIAARSGTRWQEIYNGDKTVAVGGFKTKISVKLPEGTDTLRFTCTAPEGGGILIDDVRIGRAAPMKVESVACVQSVTPVLVRNEADPLLRILIAAEGNQQPLSLNSIALQLKGAELMESVSIRHIETDSEFASAKADGASLLLRGSATLEEGDNTFLVSVRLRNDADIDKTVDAACERVTLSDGLGITPQTASPAGEKRLGIALRRAGDDGCVRYRIPGLDVTPKGTLIAVYDARWKSGGDLPGDIDVGMSRSTDGGRSWEPMRIIMDMGKDPKWRYDGIGDPCVLVDQLTGTIWVGATWSHGNRSWHGSGPGLKPEETGQYMLVKSEDDGRTWSKPINITAQVKLPEWCFVLPSPGRGITLSDGTLVMPSQFQDTPENRRMPYATIIHSQDRGATWTIGAGARSNTTECRVVELSDGTLMLNMRDNRGGSRAVCTTRDLGRSWQEHPSSRSALPEPVCNACLISLKADQSVAGRNMLIFCNPNTTRGRHRMTLKVSFDDGLSWPEQHHLLLDAGSLAGYPSMALIDRETLGVLYEGSRADLTFQRIKIRDLLNAQASGVQE